MLIGLTGPAGCGKSAALKIFSSLGWLALDADAICHKIYASSMGGFIDSLLERWGAAALGPDGCPDRQAIAQIVFSDKAEREWLNSVLHPEIQRRALSEYAANGFKPCIFDVPLLYESSWQDRFKKVIAVYAEPHVQRSRLLARGWSAGEIDRRLSVQQSGVKTLEMADYGLINNSSLDSLKRQCEAVSKLILNSI